MTYQLPHTKSTLANVLKMPHQKPEVNIDYNFNLLPIGTSQLWNKTSLYQKVKSNPRLASWLIH